MTDKEKIERIMLDKQLNNTQFSAMIGISAGALSHITGGRSNPTLNILRSIKDAFPDLNPQWLFFDEGEMYLPSKDVDAGGSAESASSNADILSVGNSDSHRPLYQADLFDMQQSAASSRQQGASQAANSSSSQHAPAPRSGMANVADAKEAARAMASGVNIKEIVEQSVAQTVDHLRQKQRKIVEVRVFFDDGTFETFSSKNG